MEGHHDCPRGKELPAVGLPTEGKQTWFIRAFQCHCAQDALLLGLRKMPLAARVQFVFV